MFFYCSHTRRLLYLTPEAELIGLIRMKHCGLTFVPFTGSPCVINDDLILLSVYSNTGNRGSVISIRYSNVGFIDHRIILNSTDSWTSEIHHVLNSNAVVIYHCDISNKQQSLRFYNINTVEPAPDVRGNVCELGGIDQYYMNHEHRGLALIISNKEFDNGETRIGTEFDVESLREVFSDLGFEVVVHENLTAKEMKSEMREVDSRLCGETPRIQNGTSGYITSPKYPHKYYNSLNCSWRIETPKNKLVEISFDKNFRIQAKSEGVCYDKLMIKSETGINRYCGDTAPGK
ncbi:caspase-1-B-like isoform X1 [Tubulanus polymorphus]|uniref:caspase-1-B-like isoform X1 n=1 Tax=Tubulanus polymorphus TaxID=672921 RepID=UPI003DA3DBE6